MSVKKLKRLVADLAAKEVCWANERFPPFASPHEGYAVVMEEVEEAREALDCVEYELAEMWQHVRQNDPAYYVDARVMKEFALNLACEAIQVAAMCDKFLALGGEQD